MNIEFDTTLHEMHIEAETFRNDRNDVIFRGLALGFETYEVGVEAPQDNVFIDPDAGRRIVNELAKWGIVAKGYVKAEKEPAT